MTACGKDVKEVKKKSSSVISDELLVAFLHSTISKRFNIFLNK